MSWNVKYRAIYKANNQNIKIDILEDNYVGGIIQIDNIITPASINYSAKENTNINGSELSFGFGVKDNTNFEPLLEAENGKHKAVFSIDNIVKWSGFLILENIQTQYFNYFYEYKLSFTDRLAQLENYTISDFSGHNTLLTYLKDCLSNLNLELDFEIILNTKESSLLNTANSNAIADSTISGERFKRNEDGRKVFDNCKDVVNSILKMFDCYLYQSNNKYLIVNKSEVNSYAYFYRFDNLTFIQKTNITNVVNIDNFKFEKANTLSKNKTLKKADIVFNNRNIKTNLINNSDFSNNILDWTSTNNGNLQLNIVDEELETTQPTGVNTAFYSPSFAIVQENSEDTIKLEFEKYISNGTNTNTLEVDAPAIFLNVSLIFEGNKQTFPATMSYGKNIFTANFANKGSGDYIIEIEIITNVTTEIKCRFDNFKLIPNTQNDLETTYDKYYVVENIDNSATNFEDTEKTNIGDGISSSDVGNLKVGGVLTKKWNTFGKNEQLPIIYLYLIGKLKQKQLPTNNLKLTIINKDNTLNINFNNIIQLENKYYIIKKISNKYDFINYIQLELCELLSNVFNFEFESNVLDAIDGESTSNNSNNYTETDPTVPAAVKLLNQTDIDNWNNKISKWETWENALNVNGLFSLKNGSATVSKIDQNGNFEGNNFIFNGTISSGGIGGDGVWGQITGILSDQTDLQTALNGKASLSHTHNISNIIGLQTALNGKASLSHTHTISNITGLQTALNGKANSVHTHQISNINNLQTTLDNKANSVHTHSLLDIKDVRYITGSNSSSNYMPNPDDPYFNYKQRTLFSYGNLGDWKGILTVKGWNDNYAAWQMAGDASTSTTDKFYVRSGANAVWNSWNELWHTGNDSTLVKTTGSQSISGAKTFDNDITLSDSWLRFNNTDCYISRNSDNLLFRAKTALQFYTAVGGNNALEVAKIEKFATYTESRFLADGNNFAIRIYNDNNNNNDNRTDFISTAGGSFFTFSTTSQEALRINFDGNIGIGTSTPSEKLEINGNIFLTGAIKSNQNQLSFLNNNSALPINTNNLLVSNSYSDRSKVPTNGAYINGDVSLNSNITRRTHNVGFLEGSYNNVAANGGFTNPIYSIGSGYNPNLTTLGSFFGIGYANGSLASFIPSNIQGSGGWGLYIASDGDARIFLDGGSGDINLTRNINAGGTVTATNFVFG